MYRNCFVQVQNSMRTKKWKKWKSKNSEIQFEFVKRVFHEIPDFLRITKVRQKQVADDDLTRIHHVFECENNFFRG